MEVVVPAVAMVIKMLALAIVVPAKVAVLAVVLAVVILLP
jgi:hypothetical protein